MLVLLKLGPVVAKNVIVKGSHVQCHAQNSLKPRQGLQHGSWLFAAYPPLASLSGAGPPS
jgi:hypothetical protein